MNTYLMPIDDGQDIWIEKVIAKDYTSAKDEFMQSFMEMYDWLDCKTWDEMLSKFDEESIFIGDIYDIEEF